MKNPDNQLHNLLVVDDEEIVLIALRDTLAREGYRIATAANALDALKLLKEQAFSVVITDQQMPMLTGLEFLAQVKQLQPDTTRILITAVLNLATVIDAINKGEIYRFIVKPWLREELLATLRNAVQRYDLICRNAALQATTLAMNEQRDGRGKPSALFPLLRDVKVYHPHDGDHAATFVFLGHARHAGVHVALLGRELLVALLDLQLSFGHEAHHVVRHRANAEFRAWLKHDVSHRDALVTRQVRVCLAQIDHPYAGRKLLAVGGSIGFRHGGGGQNQLGYANGSERKQGPTMYVCHRTLPRWSSSWSLNQRNSILWP